MTKGADGTTRVISQPIASAKQPAEPPTPKTVATPQKEGPQKVQIIRAPDGKITVRGLLAGQQLIQMPDGKLHVVMAGQQGISGQLVAASPNKPTETVVTETIERAIAPAMGAAEEPRATSTPRVTPAPPPAQIVLQGNRQLVMQPQQQVVVQPSQQVVLQPSQQVLGVISSYAQI